MSKAFDRIFIIMFENENASTVMQNAYFASLAERGVRLTNYHGVTHPSQPNYLATIGGDFFDWADDNCQDFDETNLVDLLEDKGVSWKVFIQNLPHKNKLKCQGSNVAGPPLPGRPLYYRVHNPFVSFVSNQTPERLSNIVNADELDAGSALPEFCWYGPNIANCGHSVPWSPQAGGSIINVNYSAVWLQSFLEPLLSNSTFMEGTMVVLTYDEDYPQVDYGLPEAGEPVYTVLLGSMVEAGTVQAGAYTHYNLLATIEKNFKLGDLGRNDQGAATFDFLWS
ncbi:MAG TPA: alkaline phosphatase family protein [Pyrinomonadaceae bacterium]